MFDSLYLLEDHSESQSRFALALVATLAFMGVSGSAMLGAERMRITKVSAPELSQHLLFVPNMPMIPDAKPPPPVPQDEAAGGGGGAPAAAKPDDPPEHDVESITPPDPKNRVKPATRPPTPNATGLPPGLLHAVGDPRRTGTGTGTGTGTCKGPKCRTTTRDPGALPPIKVNRSQLACTACPNPSEAELRRAAKGTLRGGRNITRFCVDTRGRVSEVHTTKSAGDPHVDGVIRRTVKNWRLRPFRVAGKERRACTTATFNLKFR